MQDSIFVCELIRDVLNLDVTFKSIQMWQVSNELREKPLQEKETGNTVAYFGLIINDTALGKIIRQT